MAVGASPLVLVAEGAPPARPHGHMVPPPGRRCGCGCPLGRPRRHGCPRGHGCPPRSSSWPCGASPLVVVAVGASSLVLVVMWCPPGRRHGRVVPPRSWPWVPPVVLVVMWCPPVILVAMCWPPLVLVLVWCPPGRRRGRVVPRSPSWPLVPPRSSSSSWVLPWLSWLCGGPPACHRGRVVPPRLSSSPWVPPARSRGRGCVRVWCPLNPYPTGVRGRGGRGCGGRFVVVMVVMVMKRTSCQKRGYIY